MGRWRRGIEAAAALRICQLEGHPMQWRSGRYVVAEPLEFNEGDIGPPGGIQILEPANASTVTEDSIKRYGGATAPTMPNARAAKKNGSASKSNGGSSGGSVSGVGADPSTS
eukprot:s2114_g1.t1